MTVEIKDSFFSQHGKLITATEAKIGRPFSHHAQFSTLVDILSRKNHHHALLSTDFSTNLHPLLLEAFAEHLNQHTIPYPLRGADILYLTLESAAITELKQLAIEKEFDALRESLLCKDNYLLLVISRLDIFSKEPKKADERFLRRQLDTLLSHPRCRLILLSSTAHTEEYSHLHEQFTFLTLPGPTDVDIITILKQQRTELEQYHHVIIPDEVLNQAYHLAERYMNASNTLENAILLLDSSAARTRATQQTDVSEQINPVLTPAILTSVLATWTHIPSSHLTAHGFNQAEFTQNMQTRIFGEETAITAIAHELQQAQIHLAKRSAPYASFLFVGKRHTGKKSTAAALAEHLFKQLDTLYFAKPSFTLNPISSIKVQRFTDKHYLPLTEVIRQTPYAIIVFDHVDQASSIAMDGLQEILTTGMLNDDQGQQYDFRQAIVILNTTVGGASIAEFSEPLSPDDDIFTMDLMQLIMSDVRDLPSERARQFSHQDLVSKILPDLTEFLPASLFQQLTIVPFLPLHKTALEKIMRLKLKVLGSQLSTRYQVELGYAPEVVRYLTNLVLIKREKDHHAENPDVALRQLYTCVEQAILSSATLKNRSNQLFLQLNETGQLLKCDWLPAPVAQEA